MDRSAEAPLLVVTHAPGIEERQQVALPGDIGDVGQRLDLAGDGFADDET